jgi:glycosyltransferase involved in cell wall biosynthesis
MSSTSVELKRFRGVTTEATDVAIIILTRNEESNIAQALRSVCGWARECFVVDSFSEDRTRELASEFACAVHEHRFENYSAQRNWALQHLPIEAEWILFLDADEWIPSELKREISAAILSNPPEAGFLIKRRLIWMGRWMKRGYYPTWLLRLFRRGMARCEDRAVNEHLIANGPIGRLENDFVHDDRRGISEWIEKHNRYATLEAHELFRDRIREPLRVALRGPQAQRTRWLRRNIYDRLPVLIRPFLYFFYRYILRGGFLDGKQAFVYHFLQALWFPILIDLKYLELKAGSTSKTG